MRVLPIAMVGLVMAFAVPASAQNLNDVGRALQDQVLGNRGNTNDRDRDAYERGRRDQEQARLNEQRRRDDRRAYDGRSDGRGDDRRRFDDADRRQRDFDRQQGDQDRGRGQSGRY